MKIHCQENLNEIKCVLHQLSEAQYQSSSNTMFGATIGQHVRHILEFYKCALHGLKTKIINYDNRKRNLLIETDTQYAIQIIDEINNDLNQIKGDSLLVLEGDFSTEDGEKIKIQTSFLRELAYCLEHSIHHQALIKVGLLALNSMSFIDDTFGLAPATIRYRKQCAQ
ncbi:DinB family protein [Formosa sp. L2A11]|uniref:DinB family protein n=1 Tax=Formosa sp. L2A11 TaxID=2686363 RepID=UPI00131B5351|nr:DinB family protein [Formosa sp. L2A11]